MRNAPADEKRAFWRGWGSGAAQRDGGDAPGALAGNIKARTLNCNSGNFCKPRAQWPGGNLDNHSYFHAPEGLFYVQESTPVIGGPGESGPMDLGGAQRSRSPSAASPAAFCPIPRCSRRSPAQRVCREEEEQGNERSFRRQAETEWSGLKVNWPEGTREGGLGHCDDEPPWAK